MAREEVNWLSTREASRQLGITVRTLYRLIDGGQVAAYKFGRVIRLKQADVDDYLERARIAPGQLEHLYVVGDDHDLAEDDPDEPGAPDAVDAPTGNRVEQDG